jgi:predicted nucleic acid-binding protein
LILLDTNVVSEVSRREPNRRVLDWLATHDAELFLPSVVVGEISYGIERIRPAERSTALSKAFTTILEKFNERFVDFDSIDALLYGKVMGHSELVGRKMYVIDGMLAALAVRHRAQLATRNTVDFEHLDIELINPWTD